jgi:hypothetical protein
MLRKKAGVGEAKKNNSLELFSKVSETQRSEKKGSSKKKTREIERETKKKIEDFGKDSLVKIQRKNWREKLLENKDQFLVALNYYSWAIGSDSRESK